MNSIRDGSTRLVDKLMLELTLIIGLLVALLLTTYVFPVLICSGILGVILIFFLSGYVFLAALFPGEQDFEFPERALLAFILSVVIVMILSLGLAYTPFGITRDSLLIALSLFVILNAAAGYYRRSKLPDTQRALIRLELHSKWRELSNKNQIQNLLRIFSATIVIATIGYLIAVRKSGEKFTEFYILGSEGVAGDYSNEVAPGEPIKLTIGIINQEYTEVLYRIEMRSFERTEQVATIRLRHEDRWETPYTFTLNKPGENFKVEFRLYRDIDPEPYRTLHLWITVREANNRGAQSSVFSMMERQESVAFS